MTPRILLLSVLTGAVGAWPLAGLAGESPAAKAGARLWAHDNLFAWCTVPFDAKHRGPEARAEMLEKLGFTMFAYDWRQKDVPTFDAEIEALQRHRIELLAWWFPFDPDDALAKATLETFRRHGVHPQLWVMQSPHSVSRAKGPALFKRDSFPATPEEQAARVRSEADRVAALVRLAAPYGCKVELYSHNGWFGMEDNELAMIARLRALGIDDVGMVYNFSHCRDDLHDDTKDFPSLWARIKDHVVAVNITGIGPKGQELYPGQGDSELGMMRTIQESGWRGPVGLIAEKGGDAEVTLGKYLAGLDALAAQLDREDLAR
jgi:sugar phosphate isomerase/epimerase